MKILPSLAVGNDLFINELTESFTSYFLSSGSNIENWHSIMRIGLINASGTKHQMHGAAYGNGIYLSPHASVSFGYSGMGYNRGGTNQKSSVSSIKSVCENSYLPSRCMRGLKSRLCFGVRIYSNPFCREELVLRGGF